MCIRDSPYESSPMAEIAGFPVRPGIYDLNGATPVSYTHLDVYKRQQQETSLSYGEDFLLF